VVDEGEVILATVFMESGRSHADLLAQWSGQAVSSNTRLRDGGRFKG
jgi:hypothetical protein